MFDLDMIVRQNNQNALEWMQAGAIENRTIRPHPVEGWSLSILAEKMLTGPPSLTRLIASFEDLGTLEVFIDLVKKFLPEYADEIRRDKHRVYRFCTLFDKKYFPLPDWSYQKTLEEFVSGMPVQLLGLGYATYHDLSMRIGYLLLLSLVPYPFDGDERDQKDDAIPFDPLKTVGNDSWKPRASDIKWLRELVGSLNINGEWTAPAGVTFIKIKPDTLEIRKALDTEEVKEIIRCTILIGKTIGIEIVAPRRGRPAKEKMNGARVPLVDAVMGIVGSKIASNIPANGWSPEALHTMTDGTAFAGCGDFADWAWAQTHTVLLDSSFEDCDIDENNLDVLFKWTKRNITLLTEQYPRVIEIRGRIDHIVEWLEQDPINHFSQLLEHLISKQNIADEVKLPSRKRNVDWPESHIPLEQVFDEEDEFEEEEDSPSRNRG